MGSLFSSGNNRQPPNRPSNETRTIDRQVITYPNARYEGEVRNGKRHGKGHLYLASGQEFVGSFVDDQMEGQGVYTWPDGRRYEGTVRKNAFNGRGTLTWACGFKFEGHFADDKLCDGMVSSPVIPEPHFVSWVNVNMATAYATIARAAREHQARIDRIKEEAIRSQYAGSTAPPSEAGQMRTFHSLDDVDDDDENDDDGGNDDDRGVRRRHHGGGGPTVRWVTANAGETHLAGAWSCPVCTLANGPRAAVCADCGAKAPSTPSMAAAASSSSLKPPTHEMACDPMSERGKEAEEIDNVSLASACVICMDARRTFAAVPCGHLCLCDAHAVGSLDALKHQCPICRAKIEKVVKIFK